MIIKRKPKNEIPSSQITPAGVYFTRRRILKLGGLAAAGLALAACAPKPTPPPGITSSSTTDELGDPLNSFEDITNYNNYYEFTTDKEGVAGLSKDFTTSPWQVVVDGLVDKPRTFGLEDFRSQFTAEERIYRLRCVEGWSMVIPWQGFSLADLLKKVEPKSNAKYVYFETIYRPDEMPGQGSSFYPWPYTEGLRLDEALHPLTTLATGVYGQDLLPANGAPIRLVVPWKYGFKSIKSIVKITLTDSQPPTFWNLIAPNEYGFYSNVNPNKPHPRWSQDTERRIGELSRRATLMFNGYDSQVKSLYAGMDLNKEY
jgi:methionine sulfoxide reductase catalytic subunit